MIFLQSLEPQKINYENFLEQINLDLNVIGMRRKHY